MMIGFVFRTGFQVRFEQVRKVKFIRYGLCVLLYNILTPSARVKMCMKLGNATVGLQGGQRWKWSISEVFLHILVRDQ